MLVVSEVKVDIIDMIIVLSSQVGYWVWNSSFLKCVSVGVMIQNGLLVCESNLLFGLKVVIIIQQNGNSSMNRKISSGMQIVIQWCGVDCRKFMFWVFCWLFFFLVIICYFFVVSCDVVG